MQEGLRLLRTAAEGGQSAAQMMLGMRLNDGQGLPQDRAEALRWFERAANQGYPGAQSMLGLIYAQGKGVKADHALAHAWLTLAADGGLDFARKNRDTVATILSPAERQRSLRLQAEFRAKIAPEPVGGIRPPQASPAAATNP
jgi:TPR repeat protein